MVPWQEDPEILERMQRVADEHAKGISLPKVAHMLHISVKTAYEDWDRTLDLYQERAARRAEDHVGELYAVLRVLNEELKRADRRSLNRGSIAAQIRQTIMDIAKLDGSSKEKVAVEQSSPIAFTLNIGATDAPGAATSDVPASATPAVPPAAPGNAASDAPGSKDQAAVPL